MDWVRHTVIHQDVIARNGATGRSKARRPQNRVVSAVLCAPDRRDMTPYGRIGSVLGLEIRGDIADILIAEEGTAASWRHVHACDVPWMIPWDPGDDQIRYLRLGAGFDKGIGCEGPSESADSS